MPSRFCSEIRERRNGVEKERDHGRGIANRSDAELRSQINASGGPEESVVVATTMRSYGERQRIERYRYIYLWSMERCVCGLWLGSLGPPIDIARSRQACLTFIESHRGSANGRAQSVRKGAKVPRLILQAIIDVRDLHVLALPERFVAHRSLLVWTHIENHRENHTEKMLKRRWSSMVSERALIAV